VIQLLFGHFENVLVFGHLLLEQGVLRLHHGFIVANADILINLLGFGRSSGRTLVGHRSTSRSLTQRAHRSILALGMEDL